MASDILIVDDEADIRELVAGILSDEGHGTRVARHALEALSNETGGIAYFPKSVEQVDQIAAEVARDIRSQYTIGYHSSKPSSQPGFRHVQVTASAKGMHRLTARTRTGYFPMVHLAPKAH